ncbi:hypothetical protein JCM10295v2_001998 [Rhodotorula toruloides]
MSSSDLDFLNQTLATPSGGTNGSSTDVTTSARASRPSHDPSAPWRRADAPSPTSSSTTDAPLSSLVATLHSAQSAATRLSTVVPDFLEGATQVGGEGDELSEQALNAMLAQLDEAEGAADDLEGRLDGLIGHLDQLLGALGGVGEPDRSGEKDSSESAEGTNLGSGL